MQASIDLDRVFAQLDVGLTQFTEALSRRAIDKQLAPAEIKLQKALAKLFEQQSRAILRKLGPIRHYFVESAIDDFDDLFDSASLATSADMLDVIDTAIQSALISGGKALLKDFNFKAQFSLTNPRAIAYTAHRAAEAITGIDNTTKADIRKIILAGISDGASYSEVANNIKARYTQYAIGVPQRHLRSRAELIAVTELGNAYQQGNLAAAHQMSESGLKMQKKWLTTGDDRVSDGCLSNAKDDWISIDTAHNSGHDCPLRFPGCRCVEQYRRQPTQRKGSH